MDYPITYLKLANSGWPNWGQIFCHFLQGRQNFETSCLIPCTPSPIWKGFTLGSQVFPFKEGRQFQHNCLLQKAIYSIWYLSPCKLSKYEPGHSSSYNITWCPVKTQISLHSHTVWSESLQGTMWVAKDPKPLQANSISSDQTADAQADLSLCWVLMQSCRKCSALVHMSQRWK